MIAATQGVYVVDLRPGTTAVRVTATLTTGLALVIGGAGLAVAATPSAATTTVNIRAGASTSHAVLGELVRGQRITATSTKAGWSKVDLGGRTAYVASRYLDGKGAMPAAPKRIDTSGSQLVTETLNVRRGPSTSSAVVGSLTDGRRITLTGRQRGGFAQTRYAGALRWVSVAYLASTPSGPATSTPTTPTPPVTSGSKGRAALAFARSQLGKPYVFGAAGPSSYDCSGLMLAAWRSAGVSLPRTSQQQYAQGRRVARSDLRPGDLVFFYSQSPSHVGMYVGNGMIIHAPRPGRSVEYIKMSYMPYAGAVRPA